MNPYNTAERLMPRNYNPVATVTWELHKELGYQPLPFMVKTWAESNLPDGDYAAQYTICDDAWHFGRAEWIGERRRIVQLKQVY